MGDVSNWISIILQMLGVLGGVAVFFYRIHLSLNLLMQQNIQAEKKIATMELKMEQLSQVIIDMAKQNVRLDGLDARVQEISNFLLSRAKSS